METDAQSPVLKVCGAEEEGVCGGEVGVRKME